MHLRALALVLLLVLLVLVPASGQDSPEGLPVREVEFRGAPWIPRQGLVELLGVRPGDRLDPEALRRGVERVLAHPAVLSLSPPAVTGDAGGVAIRIDVEGLLTIRSRPFPGARFLSAEELREGLRSAPGELAVEADIEADRRALIERYQDEGFLLADVTTRLMPAEEAPGMADLEFEVEEGRRVTIRAIRVEGNESLSAGRILGVIEHRPRLLFGIIARGFYRPARFEEDLERVRQLYRDRGHLDVTVAMGPPRLVNRFREVELSIVVDEGPRFRLEAIELGGANPALTRAIKFQIRSRPGDYYDGRLLEEDRRRILRFYERETERVPEIRLTHFFHLAREDHRVRVSFDVDERRHLFAVRVDVRGNARTRGRVVRRAATVIPAGPLTGIHVEETARAVQALGIFERTDVAVEPSASPAPPGPEPAPGEPPAYEPGDLQDVAITVAEKERGEGLFELGGGASSGEGEVFAVRLRQPNFDLFDLPGGARGWNRPFRGGGQLLDVAVYPGTKISEFAVRFEEPYLHNSFHALSVSGVNRLFRWRKYDEVHLAGEVGVRRTWDRERRFSTTLSWVLREVAVTDADDDVPDDVMDVEGYTLFSHPALVAAYSGATVDFYSGPNGLTASTRLELPLEATGSDTDHVKSLTTVEWSWRVNSLLNRFLPGEPLDEDAPAHAHALRLAGRLGWMEQVGGGETPFFDRFMLGGPRSLRGFEYRGVGPREEDIALGGDAFWAASVEYSLPLFLPELRAVALFDAGDVEARFSGLSLDRVRTAAGGGVEVRIRLLGQGFPVNLYWVEALRKQRDDEDRVFTFSLGYFF